MPAAERLVSKALPWLLGGAAAALPLLVLPPASDLLLTVTVHLSLVTAFGLALTGTVAPLADQPWFAASAAGRTTRAFGAAATTIAVVTFVVGLVALATSAALRYDVSLQYLQLLSAMDIAWVVAATYLGARLRWGDSWAWMAGIGIGIACVWSIWRYLDTVGFTATGGWLVSGPELFRLVILFDMIAAVVAVATLSLGVRHATAQRSPQS